jgi:hypothetical protein
LDAGVAIDARRVRRPASAAPGRGGGERRDGDRGICSSECARRCPDPVDVRGPPRCLGIRGDPRWSSVVSRTRDSRGESDVDPVGDKGNGSWCEVGGDSASDDDARDRRDNAESENGACGDNGDACGGDSGDRISNGSRDRRGIRGDVRGELRGELRGEQ